MSLLRRIEGQRPAGTPENPSAPGGAKGPDDGPIGSRPPQAGPRPQTPAPSGDVHRALRGTLQTRIINNLDPRLNLADVKAVRAEIESMFNKFIDEDGTVITRVERQRMLEQIVDEILGFGPIQPLLNDDSVTEVMVNRPFPLTLNRQVN